ncbi:MAG: EpsG family protein [Fibrobacter sp.]|nr:EpsG family protein [Fibrobacter sp.]
MILIAGLKYRVGLDALLYQDLFEVYPTIDKMNVNYIASSRWGKLFILWYSLCHTIFKSFVSYQFIHAIIITSAIYVTLKENTRHVFYGLFFYFLYSYLFFTFDLYREGMAVALFLLGYRFLLKNNLVVYYVFAFLAFNIHTSCILIFFVPFLKRFKITKKNSLAIFITSLLLSVVAFQLMLLFLNMLPSNSVSILALRYLKRYSGISGLSFFRLLYCSCMFFFVVYKNISRGDSLREQMCLNLGFLSLIIMIFEQAIPFIFRLNSYFIIFFICSFCLNIEYNNFFKKNTLVKFLIVVVMASSVKLVDYFGNPRTYNAYCPYVSVLDPYKVPSREWHGMWAFLYYDQKL